MYANIVARPRIPPKCSNYCSSSNRMLT